MFKLNFKLLGLAAVAAGAASADARVVLRRVGDGRSLSIQSNDGDSAVLNVEAEVENPRTPSN